MRAASRLGISLLLGGLLILTALPGARAASAGPSLLPSLDNPRLHFNTGRAVQNRPEIAPELPAIPGPPSGWTVTQWNQSSWLSPTRMTRQNPATEDPELGRAAYGFATPDGHSHVWIYDRGKQAPPVFALFERGGTLRPGGGANLFLSANLDRPIDFTRRVLFSLRAKVSAATVSYATAGARASGAVLGMAFIGFAINFPSPETGKKSVLFLQVSLTSSRDQARIATLCRVTEAGNLILIMGGTLDGALPLPFRPSSGPATGIAIPVNDYIDRFRASPITCRSRKGPRPVTMARVAPGSIVLKSIYVGLETQDRDARANAVTAARQGQVALGLQISDIRLHVQNAP